MKLHLLTAAAAVLLAACATSPIQSSGPGALDAAGPVAVSWSDPALFSEVTYGVDRRRTLEGIWVRELAEYLRESAAPRLAAGDRLEIRLLDIDRAGEFEPWHAPRGQDIRVLRNVYPPRINLEYRLVDGSGAIKASGEERLVDLSYLSRGGTLPHATTDTLRHEKRLLDDWLYRLLGSR